MSWDKNNLSPEMRAEMLMTGRQFSSVEARAQGNRTLQALAEHREALVDYGFGDEEEGALKTLAAESTVSTAVKDLAKSDGKVQRTQLRTSVRTAKKAKRRAVSTLQLGARKLRLIGTEEAVAVAVMIERRIQDVTPTAFHLDHLARQMGALKGVLENPAVEQATGAAGIMAKAALEAALGDLVVKKAAYTLGNPVHEEQEQQDVVDGLIVTLCRLARAAARAAAADLEQPALAKAFELSALYK